MKRLGAVLGILAAGWAGAVRAADLPGAAPAPSYSPVYRPHIYDWTGFYFGGNIGGGYQNNTYTDTTTTTVTTTAGTAVLEPAGNHSSHAEFGTVGGAQIGVNYQMTPLVVGLEGTFSLSTLTGFGLSPSPLGVPVAGAAQVRDTTSAKWFATGTARVGYALDQLLLYVKGGAAWTHIGLTRDVLLNGFGIATGSLSDTRSGWTAGAGLEWGITENLSARLEYDYLDFGTKNYTYLLVPLGATPISNQSQTHMLTGGVNYRFTWGGGGG